MQTGTSAAQAVLAVAPPTPSLPAPASTPDSATASAAVAPAPMQPPVAPSDKPGGRFAGLFAPITTQTMGLGQWGRAAPRPPEDEAAQRWRQQQAMVAASQALWQRTEQWRQRLHMPEAVPLRAACEVRLWLTAQTAEVTCQDATDQARVDQELGGISWLTRAPAHALPTDTQVQCMHIAGKEADWVDCPGATAKAVEAAGAPPSAPR